MNPRHALLLCSIVVLQPALPADGVAAGYSSGKEIAAACREPFPHVVSPELRAHLQAGIGAVASMPKVSCIAVLFGDSRDSILSFMPAADGSYFATRTASGTRSRPAYAVGQTPVNFARRLGSGWQIRRWDFETREFKIAQGRTLTFRRVDAQPSGVLDRQTIRVVKTFPIEQDGKVVERLHLLVDDWGKWRSASEPAERKWHVYSERSNAVLLHSALYTEGSSGREWDSADVRVLAYMKGSEFDLVVNADQLAPFRAYMDSFHIWKLE